MKRILAYGMTDNPGGIESYLLSIVEKAQHKGMQLDFVTDFPTIAYEEILKKIMHQYTIFLPKGKNYGNT